MSGYLSVLSRAFPVFPFSHRQASIPFPPLCTCFTDQSILNLFRRLKAKRYNLSMSPDLSVLSRRFLVFVFILVLVFVFVFVFVYIFVSSQTGFQEFPYGTCGHKKLSMFPNDNYTTSHCQRECDTLSLLSRCSCTEPYMNSNFTQGNARYKRL
jgi:hypothetical protein